MRLSRLSIGLRPAAALLLAALALIAARDHVRGAAPQSIDAVALGSAVPAFPISSGPVSGLYPGASRPLAVTVKNPFTFAIKVTSLTFGVKSLTSSKACAGANLRVSPYVKALVVKARKSATVTTTVTMPASAADACKGAAFTLVYGGKAVRA